MYPRCLPTLSLLTCALHHYHDTQLHWLPVGICAFMLFIRYLSNELAWLLMIQVNNPTILSSVNLHVPALMFHITGAPNHSGLYYHCHFFRYKYFPTAIALDTSSSPVLLLWHSSPLPSPEYIDRRTVPRSCNAHTHACLPSPTSVISYLNA